MCLEAYVHQDIPFEKLVEELQPERDLSRSPLFQVTFALQNVPRQNMELTGLSLSAMEIDTEAAKFDLSLFMWETADGIKGALEYSADLFEAETIVRMIGHFQTLLEGVVENPDQRLSDLQILTEAERKQILIDWNDTSTKYPRNRCIHQLFEEQVEQSPDAVAVVNEDEQLTYRQLNARSNQLAHYLKKLGVGPEVLVGVCLERSVEMVIGLLGILKAGGAYVPLDPSYPKERLNFILNDTRTQVLLTEKRLLEVLLVSSAHAVCLDTDRESIEKESTENPAGMAAAENLAYVIYTSGSTGRPKGVSITHCNAIALLYWAKETFNSKDLVGVLASTSICFDLSVFELFVPLSWGGKVIMAENVLQLIDLPSAEDVTLVNTVPSAIAELLRIGKLPDSVRTVNLAGEVLKNNLVKQIYQAGKVSQVLDLYGPSEDTTYTTFALRDGDSSATIGRAISNAQIYILDRNLQAVPIGVAGEIYIGGDGLARGYLNRPDLTAEKFIPNPFSNNSGGRLYKTGDFARYLFDGNIEFLGRMDQQVKIRGFRIELGEIEAALGQHSAVRDTVVIAREDAAGDKRLVAYVVPKIKIGPSVNELHNYLKKRLPNYMVPSVFVVMESLPLMPNGKLDRKALPEPKQVTDSITYQPERAFIAPRDNIEFQLVQIWEDILNVRPIGVRDNFFDIGGHSLLVMRLMSQIKSKFGKKLPVATLFKEATIEYLAVRLRQQTVQLKRSPLIEIKPTGSKLPFYCVHPGGGNVFCYLDLARTLGTDQPFYGLQHPGLDGQQKPFTYIEEIADLYIKSLMAQQPEGPYLLGGWSMGGMVAFEMAQQLSAQGHQIELLALIDTQAVDPDNQPPEVDNAVLLIHFAKQLGLSLDKHAFSKLKPDVQLGYILRQAKAANLVTSDIELTQLGRHVEVYMRNVKAMRTYRPRVYSGRISLFTASQRSIFQDETLGWHKFTTGGVATHKVPGDHYTMLKEPHVQILSDRLRHCIDEI
jgi:amino acid adenylation domain-containing protein